MQLTKIRHGSQPVRYLQEPLLGVGEGVNYYFKVINVRLSPGLQSICKIWSFEEWRITDIEEILKFC